MTTDRWQRIKSILEEASAAGQNREAVLDRLCAGDPELRREVDQLSGDSGGGSMLHAAISSAAAEVVAVEGDSPSFGHYQLVRPIGKGGMGMVYEAIRVNDFRKRVALKIIQTEFDSDSARARFQQERQFLATLEHPYIARLLDGGTTPAGAPYLVMEYIQGEPITVYCRNSRLAQVLELFNQICGAVDYAHQKGIVHRDIKPGNILVTPEGIPKLLDFGIARSAEPRTEAFPLTAPGLLTGTLHYMSPEQVRGQTADARSDIFSLGVVLFELICGARPFVGRSAGEVMAAILERPTPPITAPSGTLPPALAPLVERALRKNPAERFATARELLDELKRIHYALELAATTSLLPAAPLPIRIELFGKPRVFHGGQPLLTLNTNRLQSLLAYLVLSGDVPQSREQIAYLLWPESSESQARTNLRQLLHHLRRALPSDCRLLEADNHTVRWRRDGTFSTDVAEFDEALKRGGKHAERAALEEAVQLYQDDLARGLYDSWLEPKREHYRQEFAKALARLAAILEESRDYPGAIRQIERLVAHDPLREANHQTLIRLYAANNDRASALRAYHQCMRVLRRELGVEPGAATRSLFERILKSEAASGAHPEVPPTAAVAALPLIGRKKEWERLAEACQASARGTLQLAVVSGEPGIGKSRLAEELFQFCARDGWSTARTRCYAGQGQAAYAPIADWLKAPAVRSARPQLAPSQLAELARVLPEILEEHPQMPRPRPLTESWERLHFYDSINAAFTKTQAPLLLLIDDLQWCDGDSFEWMHALFRTEAGAHILVLGTLREEEAGRDHPCTRLLSALRQSGQAVEIPLLPLSAEETIDLAVQVSDQEIAGSDLARLFRATKGHPLFVVESVRAGLRTPEGGSRIQSVIAGRLEQLSASAFELAGLASAIGRAFSFDLLAKATDWDENSVSKALDELWQRRIIEGHGASEYDFTHDRLREVAYAGLSLVRRRFLHRRIALALEEAQSRDLDSRGAQLAAHYEAAGMAEPAMRHYEEAAAVAQQRFADPEAAGLLRRALSLCSEFPDTAKRAARELELLSKLGPVLVTTQGYAMPEVGENYERALVLSRQLNDAEQVFVVLSGAWVVSVVRGQLEKARELSEEYLDLARQRDLPALLMAGHFILGSSLFHLGRLAAAREHLEQSLRAHTGRSEAVLALFAGPDVGVFAMSYLAHALWHLGEPEQAAAMLERAIASAHQVGHPFSLAIALNYAAMLCVFRRESKPALVRAEEAAAVCRKHQFAYYLSVAETVAGWAQAMEGQPERGLARLRDGLEALKATGAQLRLPLYHGLLAEACALAGQDGEAMANVSTGFAFLGKNGEAWTAPGLHHIHGDLAWRTGQYGQARASYRKAVKAAGQIGAVPLETRAGDALSRPNGELGLHRTAGERPA